MGKFGFSDETIASWQDDEKFFLGKKDIAVVIFHGWSGFPRQMGLLGEVLNEKGYSVYLPRLTGHGRTPEELETAKMDNWISDCQKAFDFAKKKFKTEKIFAIGFSLGGNLALISSQSIPWMGVVSIGSPMKIKNDFWARLAAQITSWFNLYFKKRYPKGADLTNCCYSYQYFPAKSARESFRVITKSRKTLSLVQVPLLIMQAKADYLSSADSPDIIQRGVASNVKLIRWMNSDNQSHLISRERVDDYVFSIDNFIKLVLRKKQ